MNSYDEVLRQPYTLWKHEEIAQQSITEHEIILEDNQEEKMLLISMKIQGL